MTSCLVGLMLCFFSGGRIRLSEEEEGLDESLSECLSSASIEGRDEDSLSDLNLQMVNEDFV